MTAKAGDRPKNLNQLEALPIKGSGVIEAEINSNTGNEIGDELEKSGERIEQE